MIAKISQGKGFRGALDYVLKADSEVIGGNMAGRTARSLASEFGVTRALRNDIDTCCYHVSLSLPAGERFSAGEWETVAATYLSRMGLSPTDHQYVLVRHNDTELDHVHIITSRISLEGTVWKPFRDRIKSRDICRQLEAEHHLTAVSNEKKQYRARTTQAERRMSERTGREPEKVFVQKAMNEILTEGTSLSPQVFCSELEKCGIVAIPNVAKTGKMNGFAFQYAGRSYTGSQVGYSWKHLEKFIDMKFEDVAWMQERKKRLQEGTPSDAVRSIRNAVWEVGIQGVHFDRALEKQGWRIQGGRMIKGSSSYELSSIVDRGALGRNLRALNSVSKKAKEAAREKSRELARLYHGMPRRSFMAEMKTEDVLCGMMMFPQVVVFLVVLSVLTEVMRNIERPQTEAEFKEKLRAIWDDSNTEVRAEIRRIQEEINNAGAARAAGRNQTNISVAENAGRKLRTADESRESGMFQVGKIPDSTTPRIEGSHTGDERNREPIAVETTDTHSNDDSRIRRGSSPAPAGSLDAGDKSRDGATTPPFWGAVEEWADLARDISSLVQGAEEATMTTAASRYKAQVWGKQANALGAPAYRITLRSRTGEGLAWNLGKDQGADGGERFWTADEVAEMVPMLASRNARGNDVYVTPIDPDFHYVLLDDLHRDGLDRLLEDGYDPCWVGLSSADNYQAVLKIPVGPDGKTPAEQSLLNTYMRELNVSYGGDEKISAVIHPFRTAGFRNKKTGRGDVETKIEIAIPRVSERAVRDIETRRRPPEDRGYGGTIFAGADQRETTWAPITGPIREPERAAKGRPPRVYVPSDDPDTAHRAYAEGVQRYLGLARKMNWEIDLSAIDFNVAAEMGRAGHSADEIVRAMMAVSPNIRERHPGTHDYAWRTVEAAMRGQGRERESEWEEER